MQREPVSTPPQRGPGSRSQPRRAGTRHPKRSDTPGVTTPQAAQDAHQVTSPNAGEFRFRGLKVAGKKGACSTRAVHLIAEPEEAVVHETTVARHGTRVHRRTARRA